MRGTFFNTFKTFVLATYLQEVEAGRLDETEQLAVDDGVRSFSSPVFEHLTGTTQARSALEAMIAHSDNTGTDMALKRVTPARVRQFGLSRRAADDITTAAKAAGYAAAWPWSVLAEDTATERRICLGALRPPRA